MHKSEGPDVMTSRPRISVDMFWGMYDWIEAEMLLCIWAYERRGRDALKHLGVIAGKTMFFTFEPEIDLASIQIGCCKCDAASLGMLHHKVLHIDAAASMCGTGHLRIDARLLV